ncbi:MAG: LPS assembly lipoprotein LptE [Bacteroidia bacterium]|nr:LPS assembly lipoprotein LptE [Bacteroidia bacterium]
MKPNRPHTTLSWLSLIPAVVLLLLTPSCGIYSFTGASIPPEARTFSVEQFANNALLVEPLLSNTMTNALRDRFTSQTTLRQTATNGDLAFEGEITDYSVSPVAIQSDQTAALNRLTITVNVRFYNKFEESKNFESRFTQYLDYPSDQDLNVVKDRLIREITDMLIDNIFNKAVVNW